MKKFLNKNRKTTFIIALLSFIVFGQALFIGKMYSERDFKEYEVNLVQINHEKDSIDYMKMKHNLTILDKTLHQLNAFLMSKNVPSETIGLLAQDSLANALYLAKTSNRYSQYLVDLEQKLQLVPLGLPTNEGYVSSNFGMRKNPIPPKNPLENTTPEPTKIQYIEEKDSLGNVIKRTPIAENNTKKDATKTAVPMQFHKGIDVALPFGSDIRCTASGKVIFAGQKGGYGQCVIVSHGNGLATLYAHLSQVLVEANDNVKVSQVIAKSGNSGRSTGPHLHYEVHKNNVPVNPRLFLNL